MSEEIELNEGDLLVPAPADFDMFDMIEEVDYPEDTVTVALNERAAFELIRLEQDIAEYMESTEDPDKAVLAEYRKDFEDIKKRIDDSKMTFYLKGVGDETVAGAQDVAEAKFEELKKPTKAADGTIRKYLPESEKINFMRYLNAVTYAMHITKFVRHRDGATRTTPSPDEIAAFMDRAPEAAKALLTDRIQRLRVRASDYEAKLDEGFFQKS